MRTVSLAVVAVAVLVPSLAVAQAEAGPPEVVPPAEKSALPGGTEVSQPLQNATPFAESSQPLPGFTDITQPQPPKPGQILGRWWDTDELLLWWPKAHSLPPLVTATRSGAVPVLGRQDTQTLVGGRAIDNQDIAGWRTVLGLALNDADTVGIEGRYFFLGTRTLSSFATDLGNPRIGAIGLPFVNALTGDEDVLTVARPGFNSALVTAYTTTRVQGAEGNVVVNLIAAKSVKLHAIAGYRYFQLNEGLRLEQTLLKYGTHETLGHTAMGLVADQFSTGNSFSGGQLGLHADVVRDSVFIEFEGKLALGSNFQKATIGGETHLLTFGTNPLPLVRSHPGGAYAQNTNSGRLTNSAFALVPEGTVKFGVKSDRSRFYVGYNYLYLSDAIRPGDQVDRRLNPNQIPLVSGGAPFRGPEFPHAQLVQTDFWLQGLVIGWEARY